MLNTGYIDIVFNQLTHDLTLLIDKFKERELDFNETDLILRLGQFKKSEIQMVHNSLSLMTNLEYIRSRVVDILNLLSIEFDIRTSKKDGSFISDYAVFDLFIKKEIKKLYKLSIDLKVHTEELFHELDCQDNWHKYILNGLVYLSWELEKVLKVKI